MVSYINLGKRIFHKFRNGKNVITGINNDFSNLDNILVGRKNNSEFFL